MKNFFFWNDFEVRTLKLTYYNREE